MDENNNFQNMGPDPNLLSGNPQPQADPYAQPQTDPYAQPQGDPYAQPQADPYAQPQGDPYAQQQANPYGQPQGDPYAQPQANPYGQPQGDPYAQQQASPYGQPQAQSGPAMEYNNQPSQDYGYQAGPAMNAQPPQPPKKKKTGLIIGIIAAAVLLIGGGIAAFFLFFNGSSDGKDGAEAVCKKFLNAYGDLDVNEMFECFPKEMSQGLVGSEFSGSKKELEQTLSFLKGMFEINDIKAESSELLSDSELQSVTDKFNKNNNCSVKFDKGAKVEMSFTMKVSFMGQSQEEDTDITFFCGYKDKKWYIIDANQDGSIDDITEEMTEATTEAIVDYEKPATETDLDNDDDDDDDEPFVSTAQSHTVDAPAGLSDKLEDMQFSFEGNIYKVPFPVADLPSDWGLIFELDDDEKNIAAGETSYSNGYKNDKYDNACSVYVSVKNNTTAEIPYEKGDVTSFTLSVAYCDDGAALPELILPKGITWGSTEDDIKAAYGDDYSVYDTSDGETRTITYSLNDYADTIALYIDHEDGLNYVYINHYEY